MRRAQAEIVSVALIITLTLTFIGVAYTWLYPWIERKQEEIKVGRLLNDFDPNNPKSLPRKIENIARVGGEDNFRVSGEGIWVLYPFDYSGVENNSIQFSTFSKFIPPRISIGKWKNLTTGECPIPSQGKIGETPYVVCVRADPQLDGYNITFRIIFRELLEAAGNKGSKIILKKWTDASPVISVSREVKIGEVNTYQKLVDSKMLIITEIKISLI
jgi:hypothetical protein